MKEQTQPPTSAALRSSGSAWLRVCASFCMSRPVDTSSEAIAEQASPASHLVDMCAAQLAAQSKSAAWPQSTFSMRTTSLSASQPSWRQTQCPE